MILSWYKRLDSNSGGLSNIYLFSMTLPCCFSIPTYSLVTQKILPSEELCPFISVTSSPSVCNLPCAGGQFTSFVCLVLYSTSHLSGLSPLGSITGLPSHTQRGLICFYYAVSLLLLFFVFHCFSLVPTLD